MRRRGRREGEWWEPLPAAGVTVGWRGAVEAIGQGDGGGVR